ncbi:MAG: hypothetical protein ABFS56_20945 [Pseudomonadota bacterium]
MAIIPRYESHEHLGDVVILEGENGWAEVGQNEDVDRRQHWFRFQAIAIRGEKPFLTLGDAREAMISGMYHEKRQENNRLRAPDDLICSNDLDTPLTGLNWYEANALCELRYGRLATEKEVDLIFCHLSQGARVDKVWTLSKWSDWSYALCGYDADKQRWYAAEDQTLIEENKVSVFNLKALKRECFSPGETERDKLGAIIVFDCNDNV